MLDGGGMPDAEDFLTRFGGVIDWAARYAASVWAPWVEYEDAQQEARILVLSYCGITPGWKHGTLARIERATGDDESRTQTLLAVQLRLDLSQVIGRREMTAPEMTIPLSVMPPEFEPAVSFENEITEQADSERGMRERYPFMAKRIIDGLSEREIALKEHLPLRTVERRIAGEKLRAASGGTEAA